MAGGSGCGRGVNFNRDDMIDFTFIVCDDFDRSVADLYGASLFAFYILQCERPRTAPYVHELEINSTTSGSY